MENKNVSESQPERAVIRKGDVAMCDLIDANKRPTGEQIEVTIVDIRLNGDTPQSYRVYCKTERGTDKYIWVQRRSSMRSRSPHLWMKQKHPRGTSYVAFPLRCVGVDFRCPSRPPPASRKRAAGFACHGAVCGGDRENRFFAHRTG